MKITSKDSQNGTKIDATKTDAKTGSENYYENHESHVFGCVKIWKLILQWFWMFGKLHVRAEKVSKNNPTLYTNSSRNLCKHDGESMLEELMQKRLKRVLKWIPRESQNDETC